MKSLVEFALRNSARENRYQSRLKAYPKLAKFGCLPEKLSDISSDEAPWFCHGLAFRMATYANDHFARWEELLNKAQQADGWIKEYEHWNSPSDHWAKKWDRFHQFLWMLQCYEYFSECGHKVSFPPAKLNAPMTDMLVERPSQSAVYVECYFYSKWWPQEEFIGELLRLVDPNLTIKRTHNAILSSNPFSNKQFKYTLALLAAALTPDRLAALRISARDVSPQQVCKIGDVEVLLEGDGEYQPSTNAHGDSSDSWPIFVKEIIEAKETSNGLGEKHPNLVLVNSLGLDFQSSFAEDSQVPELPPSIDEIWISKCGIDEKLGKFDRVKKMPRLGYNGSGL